MRRYVVVTFAVIACGDPQPSNGDDGGTSGSSSASTSASSSASVTASTSGSSLSGGTTRGDESSSGSVRTTTTSMSSDSGADVPDERAGFTVGLDVAAITPTELQPAIYLGAYGLPFTRVAEGVHDEIYVRSFAVGLDDSGIVLAVTDLPGLGNHFTRDVRARVAEATGLSEHRVLLSATHSHSSHDFQGLWGGGPASYRDVAIDRIVASMTAAWDARDAGKEARPAEATGAVPTLSVSYPRALARWRFWRK